MKTATPRAARIVAVNFAENNYLEMLIAFRAKNQKTFDTLSPALIHSVNQYSANKREFERLQAIKAEASARRAWCGSADNPRVVRSNQTIVHKEKR